MEKYEAIKTVEALAAEVEKQADQQGFIICDITGVKKALEAIEAKA